MLQSAVTDELSAFIGSMDKDDRKPHRSQAPDFSRGEQQIFSSFQAPRFIYGVNPKSKIQNPKSNDISPGFDAHNQVFGDFEQACDSLRDSFASRTYCNAEFLGWLEAAK